MSKVQNNVLLGSSNKKAVRSNYWAFDLAVAFASRDPIRLPFTGKIQEVAYTDTRRPVIISYAFGSRAKRARPFFPLYYWDARVRVPPYFLLVSKDCNSRDSN